MSDEVASVNHSRGWRGAVSDPNGLGGVAEFGEIVHHAMAGGGVG
ncbi:3-oxoacyl-(acyl carrier protein) synthase [Synechococcus sp. RS9916]|nr:3-oxoacyl-(acyl carrier protein) synthase [Synechococcus sp. RS9916]